MPKKDPKESTSGATLTQRRNGGSTSSGPSGVLSQNNTPQANLRSMSEKAGNDDGSVIKIIVWGIIILATGIGLAFLVRNMTQNSNTENAQTTGDSIETTETEDTDTTEEIPEEETVAEDEMDDTAEVEETDPVEEPVEEEVTEETQETNTEDTTTTTTTEYSTYSRSDKTLEEGLSTNAVTISGYTYETNTERFAYSVKLSNASTYPTTTAVLDETAKTITLKVNDIKADNIVGNGGSGSTNLGSTNAKTVDISNSANVTSFVFSLDKASDFRLVKGTGDDGSTLLTIEIKN